MLIVSYYLFFTNTVKLGCWLFLVKLIIESHLFQIASIRQGYLGFQAIIFTDIIFIIPFHILKFIPYLTES
jgi:hypothetical protein